MHLSNNYIYVQYVCMYVCEANMSSRTLPASTSWFMSLLHCWMRSKSRFFCCLRLRAIEARAVANSSSSWETQQVRGLEFTDTIFIQWDWISMKQNCLMHAYTYSTYKQYFGTQEIFRFAFQLGSILIFPILYFFPHFFVDTKKSGRTNSQTG